MLKVSQAIRNRAAVRGIDLDQCYKELLDEVAVMPPAALLHDLGETRIVATEAELGRPHLTRDHRHPTPAPREQDCLRGIAKGMTNKEIAKDLGIGVESVKTTVASVLMRLNANNRAHAVSLAYQRGILRVMVP